MVQQGGGIAVVMPGQHRRPGGQRSDQPRAVGGQSRRTTPDPGQVPLVQSRVGQPIAAQV